MKHILIVIFSFAYIFNGFGQTAEEYYRSGVAKDLSADQSGAIADYTKAIELDSKYIICYYNRGLAKFKLQDIRGAMADLTKAIELDPKYAGAYYLRGLAKIHLSRIDSGCLDLSKAGELGHPDAYESIQTYCN
jgi:tetratricopeptide (TPR) repeat protein